MFLTPEQLRDLTGKVRYSAQIRALRTMGIDHRVRPDGYPLVLRSALEPRVEHSGQERAVEPDWSMLG